MYRGLSISVVIPCFNEERGIGNVLRNMPEYVDEVIVVDNNSADGTARIAQEWGAQVVHEARKGYGSAYQAGLPRAQGDIVATLDGDGTYPATAIAPGKIVKTLAAVHPFFPRDFDFSDCCNCVCDLSSDY